MQSAICVDVGTSSMRASCIALKSGETLASARLETPTLAREPGEMSVDPATLWERFCRVIADCVGRLPGNVGIDLLAPSTYLHGILGGDGQGTPLTPLLLWGDTRASDQANELRSDPGNSALLNETGCPAHTSYPPARILWLKSCDPARFAKIVRWYSPKSFLLEKLCGRFVEDCAIASASGLWSLHDDHWSEVLLQRIGIPLESLPEVVDVAQIAGTLGATTARRLGLPQGLPVLAGSGDGMLANLGVGACKPAELCITLGTSAAMRRVLSSPYLDPDSGLWCYRFDSRRVLLGGATNNGGNVLQWFRTRFLDQDSSTALERELLPASGPLFFPYLYGERAPDWDSRFRGGVFGLDATSGPAELFYALTRGLLLHLRRIFERLEEQGAIERIILSGGGFRSPMVTQGLADVLGRELELPTDLEATTRGAFRLAARALGVESSAAQCQRIVKPDSLRHQQFDECYRRFCEALSTVKPLWI